MTVGRIERVTELGHQVLYDADCLDAPSAILSDLVTFVRRFVSLAENQALVVALWIAHTHAISVADFTPYLDVNSPEKGSGKSRLLEVARCFVVNPWKTENASPAALVRKVHAGFEASEPVTLLFDERDSQLGGEKDHTEVVRGILNSGYERGGAYSRVVGEGTKMRVVDYQTFGAKALAGIGALSDTVASRSIPIRMKRTRSVEKFRKRDIVIQRQAADLKKRLSAWCAANLEKLRDARPAMPEQLSDRQSDCCEPLLAIADLVGGDWPEAARRALIELCCEAQADDQSSRARLLADIREIFEGRDADRMSSAELVAALADIETSPWAEWSKGKPLTAPRLARLLAPFGIAPGAIRLEGGVLKGYYLQDFADAFSRYLPDRNRNNVTTRINIQENADLQSVTETACNGDQNTENPRKNGPCNAVTLSKPAKGATQQTKWVGPPPKPVLCALCGEVQPSFLAWSEHVNSCDAEMTGLS